MMRRASGALLDLIHLAIQVRDTHWGEVDVVLSWGGSASAATERATERRVDPTATGRSSRASSRATPRARCWWRHGATYGRPPRRAPCRLTMKGIDGPVASPSSPVS